MSHASPSGTAGMSFPRTPGAVPGLCRRPAAVSG